MVLGAVGGHVLGVGHWWEVSGGIRVAVEELALLGAGQGGKQEGGGQGGRGGRFDVGEGGQLDDGVDGAAAGRVLGGGQEPVEGAAQRAGLGDPHCGEDFDGLVGAPKGGGAEEAVVADAVDEGGDRASDLVQVDRRWL